MAAFSVLHAQFLDPTAWNRLPADAEISRALDALIREHSQTITLQGAGDPQQFRQQAAASPVIKTHNATLVDTPGVSAASISSAQVFVSVESVTGTFLSQYHLGQGRDGQFFFFRIGQPARGNLTERYQQRIREIDQTDGWEFGFAPEVGAPPETEAPAELPWKVIVGTMTAVAAAAGLMARAARNAKRKSGDKENDGREEETPAGYILQVSADRVDVNAGSGKSGIEAVAHKVMADGATVAAPEVRVSAQVTAAPHSRPLRVEPQTAAGRLQAKLSYQEPLGEDVQLTLIMKAELASREVARSVVQVRVMSAPGLLCRFEGDPDSPRKHFGIPFAPDNLFCDGNDAVIFTIDLPEEFQNAHIIEEVSIPENAKRDEHFLLRPVPATDRAVPTVWSISSKHLLLNKANFSPGLQIQVNARVRPVSSGDGCEPLRLSCPVRIGLRYVHLKLWMIGGKERGTSEVCAYACVTPNTSDALAGFPLTLEVVSHGAGRLNPRSAPLQETNELGVAFWILRYSELTWRNHQQAVFEVRCRGPNPAPPPVEATALTVDVGENVRRLVEDVYNRQDEPKLRMNNHLFQPSRLGFVFPDFLSGSYVNFRSWIYSDWDDYICGKYAARIMEWLLEKRYGSGNAENMAPDLLLNMNGFDPSQYAIWDIGPITHHFTGIHLAGSPAADDPRFFDPWWYQNWKDPAFKKLSGLFTKNTERSLMIKSSALAAVVILPLIKVAALAKMVPATTKLYAIVKGGLSLRAVTCVTIGDVHDYSRKGYDVNDQGYFELYHDKANRWQQHAGENYAARNPQTPPTL